MPAWNAPWVAWAQSQAPLVSLGFWLERGILALPRAILEFRDCTLTQSREQAQGTKVLPKEPTSL